jgi:hypothetical protein
MDSQHTEIFNRYKAKLNMLGISLIAHTTDKGFLVLDKVDTPASVDRASITLDLDKLDEGRVILNNSSILSLNIDYNKLDFSRQHMFVIYYLLTNRHSIVDAFSARADKITYPVFSYIIDYDLSLVRMLNDQRLEQIEQRIKQKADMTECSSIDEFYDKACLIMLWLQVKYDHVTYEHIATDNEYLSTEDLWLIYIELNYIQDRFKIIYSETFDNEKMEKLLILMQGILELLKDSIGNMYDIFTGIIVKAKSNIGKHVLVHPECTEEISLKMSLALSLVKEMSKFK